MKKIGKIFLAICLMATWIPLPANAKEELYQGYKESITVNGKAEKGLRIKDGKDKSGKDPIVYCYDLLKQFPTEENPKEVFEKDARCWYSRINNYLSSDDAFTAAHGKEKKKVVALALFVGYPLDGYGDFANKFLGKLTEDEARYVTQNLIWTITEDAQPDHVTKDFSEPMKEYYDTLYNEYIRGFQEETEFFPSEPKLQGDMTFHEENGKWRTGSLKITGIKGYWCTLAIKGLDKQAKFFSVDGKPITENTDFEQDTEFYIEVPEKPANQYIGLQYRTEHAVFYFYLLKYAPESYLPIQNLIRADIQEVNGIAWYQVAEDGTSIPVKEEMLEIPVAKRWEGDAGKTENISVSIMAEGKTVAQTILKEENGWKTSFFVPQEYANSDKITIAETPVPEGYKSEVTGNAKDGFIITNTKIIPEVPEEITPPDIPKPPEETNPPDTPKPPEGSDSSDVPNRSRSSRVRREVIASDVPRETVISDEPEKSDAEADVLKIPDTVTEADVPKAPNTMTEVGMLEAPNTMTDKNVLETSDIVKTADVSDMQAKSSVPQTGEENNVHLYFCFMVLSVFGLFTIWQSKRMRM